MPTKRPFRPRIWTGSGSLKKGRLFRAETSIRRVLAIRSEAYSANASAPSACRSTQRASTTASSSAIAAPIPALGGEGCAASPSRTTRSVPQLSSGSRK
jgi:hypothetical protein